MYYSTFIPHNAAVFFFLMYLVKRYCFCFGVTRREKKIPQYRGVLQFRVKAVNTVKHHLPHLRGHDSRLTAKLCLK